MVILLLSVRKVELFERHEGHDPSHHQKQCEHKNVLELVVFIEATTKEDMNKLFHCSIARLGEILPALKELIKFTVLDGKDSPLIRMVLGQDKTLVDIVARCNPVRNLKETSHELRSHNQTTKKVVQADENTRKNLRGGHARYKTHERLAKVRVDREIESEDTLQAVPVSFP